MSFTSHPPTFRPAPTLPRAAPLATRLRSLARAVHGSRVELRYFVAAYLVYNLARVVFKGQLEPAQAHARWVWNLEQSAGVAVEGSVQHAFAGAVPSALLSYVYLAAQLVVVPASLIWLHRRSLPVYRTLRNTIIATWMLSVPIFALWPVAPPRLAGLGLTDTVSQQAAVSLSGRSTIFYNLYAAVPSLHVGFAFAIGIAAAAALRSRPLKVLALLWGPLVTLSVVATGNHYVFDVVAGMAITVVGWLTGRTLSRTVGPRLRRRRAVAT